MLRVPANTKNFISGVGLFEKNLFLNAFKNKENFSVFNKQFTQRSLKSYRNVRFNSTVTNGLKKATESEPVKKKLSVKDLFKKYGYVALSIYLSLGAVDLAICYVVVDQAGAEVMKEYENKVKQFFGFGSENAKPENNEDLKSASFWTKFLIAYGLHKSLIFIRLPITASITPSVVRKLQSWGYNVGAGKIAKAAINAAKKNSTK